MNNDLINLINDIRQKIIDEFLNSNIINILNIDEVLKNEENN